MSMIDYQKHLWQMDCPRPKCGPKGRGKLIAIRRVTTTADGKKHAEVVCHACDSHMMLHFVVIKKPKTKDKSEKKSTPL